MTEHTTGRSSGEGIGDAAVAALMALSFDGPPETAQQLQQRVAAIAHALGVTEARTRVLVSSVIVAQMLPADTVVKGGIGVKLRLGEVGTRATKDIDVIAADRERFLDDLTVRLQSGWGTVPPLPGVAKKDPHSPPRVAFTGAARSMKPANPPGVPPTYVMTPYKVSLHFLGKPWKAVPLEVAHDEIDGTEFAETSPAVADQIAAIAAVLGFGALRPVPLISLEQQIAQKLHAVTHPDSQRAHDLVDLQLLWHVGTIGGPGLDLPLVAQLCQRTFDYRKDHVWPPAGSTMPDLLEPAYQVAREEVDPAAALDDDHDEDATTAAATVAPTLAEAQAWLTVRIAEIVATTPRPR